MNPFNYTIAEDLSSAMDAFARSPNPLYVAGATDVLQLLQEDVSEPGTLIDISRIGLTGIEAGPQGARIGALARLSDVADDAGIRAQFPVLATALSETASPQIRNLATVGGNLLQRTRCLYFRDAAAACNKRVPGSGCSARQGANRMNAILGTSEHCTASYPGDMAVALVMLDAQLNVSGPDGKRSIQVGDLHRAPGDEPSRDTTLRPGEIITEIVIPPNEFASSSAYVKVRDRATFEWALVSVAVGLEMQGTTIRHASVVAGGVGTTPWALPKVAAALTGRELNADTAAVAGRLAIAGALADGDNEFKMKLLPRVVEHAILSAGGQR